MNQKYPIGMKVTTGLGDTGIVLAFIPGVNNPHRMFYSILWDSRGGGAAFKSDGWSEDQLIPLTPIESMIPTWNDYLRWCISKAIDPFTMEGGNFRIGHNNFATDDRIADLWHNTSNEVLSDVVKQFFQEWSEWRVNNEDDEIAKHTRHWQIFFGS